MRRFALGPLVGTLSGVTWTTRQATSSLSSSSSSSSTTRRSRASTRTPSSGERGLTTVSSLTLYGDEEGEEIAAVVPVPSAADRLAQRQHTRLPWEARQAALSYKVCSTDWKFLDRALSALMEMDAAEVSSRSLKLSGRDLLAEVVHPVAALRQTARASFKNKKQGRAPRRTKCAAEDETEHSGASRPADTNKSAMTSLSTGTTVPSKPEAPSSSSVLSATPSATGTRTASSACSSKPRRRSKRTTVRL